MREHLHFNQTPPAAVPLPFLLAAPFFAVLAFGLLLTGVPEIFLHRWQPQLIGAIHLYTLGFLGMGMTGALLQLGPVLSGKPPLRTRRFAMLARWPLGMGALAFAAGMFLGIRHLLLCAGLLIAFALCVAIPLIFSRLSLRSARAAFPGILIAPAALFIAALFGLRLLAGHVWPELGLPRQFTNTHAGWAMAGWISVLVIAVSTEVVPMFQFTPALPRPLRWLPVLIITGLTIVTLTPWVSVGVLVIGVALTVFAISVLVAQAQRRAGTGDETLEFFRLGMIALLLSMGCLLAGILEPGIRASAEMTGTLLFIVGFAGSCLHGMSIKVVPFLVRLHLQRRLWERGESARSLPVFRKLSDARLAKTQFRAHAAGLALSAAALALKDVSPLHELHFVAGISAGLMLLLVAASMLAWQLWSAIIRGYELRRGRGFSVNGERA